jgi:serine phosphatase RsbU (regulator of sigma subunit)
MIKYFFILVFLIPFHFVFSQKENIADLLKKLKTEKVTINRIDLMLEISQIYIDSDSVSFFKQIQNVKNLLDLNKYSKGQGEYFYSIGSYYYAKGKYITSNTYYQNALEVFKSIPIQKRVADSYTCIGINYSESSMFEKSINPLINAEKIYEAIHDTTGLIQSDINLGANYGDIQLNSKAKKYYLKALELSLKVKDKESAAYCYSNLGVQEKKEGNLDKALEYYIKLESYSEQTSNEYLLGLSYINMSNLFLCKDDPFKAYQIIQKYFKLYKNSTDPSVLYFGYSVLGNTEIDMGKIPLGITHLKFALEKANEVNSGSKIRTTSDNLALAYEKAYDFKDAYHFKKMAYQLSDSIFKAENMKQLTEMETKYQSEKKEQQIHVKQLEIDKKDKEVKQQKLIIYGVICILLIIIFFSGMLFRLFKQKKKANIELSIKNFDIQQKNEEILAQRDEIQAQRDQVVNQRDTIATQQKKITDSILYASRIQNAVLPPEESFIHLIPEHFVLFKPRDIVSGDFYWVHQQESRIYLAVADCTGHGVPGAFMSMMGVAFLNEIITKHQNPSAGEILNYLRNNVIRSLHQTGKSGEQKDGMDISLCIIDKNSNQIEFAGANNPLYIVKSEKLKDKSEDLLAFDFQLLEIKGDKMPIGIYASEEKSFTTKNYSVNSGDMLYLFTDGYADQFGGTSGKKFMYSKLKQLFIEIKDKPVSQQKNILEHTIEIWMADHEQIDDILVIGVRIV